MGLDSSAAIDYAHGMKRWVMAILEFVTRPLDHIEVHDDDLAEWVETRHGRRYLTRK